MAWGTFNFCSFCDLFTVSHCIRGSLLPLWVETCCQGMIMNHFLFPPSVFCSGFILMQFCVNAFRLALHARVGILCHKKRISHGFVWSVEALTQVTTESSRCAWQPCAPPPHGFGCFAYAQKLAARRSCLCAYYTGRDILKKKKKKRMQHSCNISRAKIKREGESDGAWQHNVRLGEWWTVTQWLIV